MTAAHKDQEHNLGEIALKLENIGTRLEGVEKTLVEIKTSIEKQNECSTKTSNDLVNHDLRIEHLEEFKSTHEKKHEDDARESKTTQVSLIIGVALLLVEEVLRIIIKGF